MSDLAGTRPTDAAGARMSDVAAARPTDVGAPGDRDAAVLDVRGVRKRFGGLHALEGVDLAVGEREIVGLLGPNGSGKSTLLATVAGFLEPDGGTISVLGKRVEGRRPWDIAAAGLRRTLQTPRLPSRMTVLEVMLAGASLPLGRRAWAGVLRPGARRREERVAIERARDILNELTLLRLEHHPAGRLSGGQQKLLSLGAALMGDPRVLLLDEPTAGVHPDLRSTIAEWILEVRDRGTTLVVVEHDMGFVREVCERACVLDKGEVITSCAPSDLAKDPRVVAAYLGSGRSTRSRAGSGAPAHEVPTVSKGTGR
jgi:branched-chain amino acid transport system ATP-binding protein